MEWKELQQQWWNADDGCLPYVDGHPPWGVHAHHGPDVPDHLAQHDQWERAGGALECIRASLRESLERNRNEVVSTVLKRTETLTQTEMQKIEHKERMGRRVDTLRTMGEKMKAGRLMTPGPR